MLALGRVRQRLELLLGALHAGRHRSFPPTRRRRRPGSRACWAAPPATSRAAAARPRPTAARVAARGRSSAGRRGGGARHVSATRGREAARADRGHARHARPRPRSARAGSLSGWRRRPPSTEGSPATCPASRRSCAPRRVAALDERHRSSGSTPVERRRRAHRARRPAPRSSRRPPRVLASSTTPDEARRVGASDSPAARDRGRPLSRHGDGRRSGAHVVRAAG